MQRVSFFGYWFRGTFRVRAYFSAQTALRIYLSIGISNAQFGHSGLADEA
jgi:hypothetical protein